MLEAKSKRSEKLAEISAQIEAASNSLATFWQAEAYTFFIMPQDLQNSDHGKLVDAWVSLLNEALSSLEHSLVYIREATGYKHKAERMQGGQK